MFNRESPLVFYSIVFLFKLCLIQYVNFECLTDGFIVDSSQDSISTPKVQEKLHENEARVKVLTEEWAGKWNEAAKILKVSLPVQGKQDAVEYEFSRILCIKSMHSCIIHVPLSWWESCVYLYHIQMFCIW